MSKINFVGLGGMSELGCKMYLLEIDADIYIFDAGMKYPDDAVYGIDMIIPDMTYIKNNRKRVKGVFISNINDDNVGALPKLMDIIEAPIYGSKFTISVIKKEIQDKNQVYVEMNINRKEKLSKITVSAFSLTYSLPGNYGFLIETAYGNIVYVGDFVFNQNVPPAYETSFKQLALLSDKQVVALALPVKGAEKNNYANSSVNFKNEINNIIARKELEQSIFMNVFTKNFLAIQTIIDAAIRNKHQVCVIGRKGYELVQTAIRNKVLAVPNDLFVPVKKVTDANRDNIIFLVLGDEGVPYELMLHILSDTHKEIRIRKQDLAVMAVPKISGSELKVSAVIDMFYTKGIDVKIIDPANLSFDIAGMEDLKMLYNMIKPKYLITTDAEYRHMIEFKSKMLDFGAHEKSVIFADAGEWITLENSMQVKGDKTDLTLETILIDGNMAEDSDNIILQEREQLSVDGVSILTVALLEKESKYKVQYINLNSKGFIPLKEQKVLISEINKTVVATVDKMNQSKNLKIVELKKQIQEAINQTIYRQIKRYPIVVVQFVMQ